ncbi:TetR/AcrR family transcriptional regulator [Streptomyces rugosispiralis]|uniref:TetR/AcrR family transcriptional regulator n=1 Tax=Streptomyces rugosispiralis TaxID=2967341 RepID=A0ABT1UQ77_9ACTN|nr:TetR/AcrR family transcriptional regulator [Streptomyces rugosispiralis]MCQ8187278.1 TetR/AcrR family transcriptional regulator [Streptomyces rugosispiralis]
MWTLSTSTGSGYHHGDLRAALLDSALALLDTEGPGELSLRAVARHAGVSPNAPYRHYRDKEALLAALATRGFTELGERLAGVAPGEHPDAEVIAMACAAVDYALDHPGVYRLMFGQACSSHPDTIAASDAAIAIVAERIAVVAEPERRKPLRVGLWALVHGLSTLLLDEQLGTPTRAEADALVETVVRTMLGAGPERPDGGSPAG